MKKPRDRDEHNEKMDPFEELLKILDEEQLIRFRKRLEKIGRKRMVEILSEEIEQRRERELTQRHKEK